MNSYFVRFNNDSQHDYADLVMISHHVLNEVPASFGSSSFAKVVFGIVIKPGPGADPVKGSGPGFYGSTRVNP